MSLNPKSDSNPLVLLLRFVTMVSASGTSDKMQCKGTMQYKHVHAKVHFGSRSYKHAQENQYALHPGCTVRAKKNFFFFFFLGGGSIMNILVCSEMKTCYA